MKFYLHKPLIFEQAEESGYENHFMADSFSHLVHQSILIVK
jgi:hypothetical protein